MQRHAIGIKQRAFDDVVDVRTFRTELTVFERTQRADPDAIKTLDLADAFLFSRSDYAHELNLLNVRKPGAASATDRVHLAQEINRRTLTVDRTIER